MSLSNFEKLSHCERSNPSIRIVSLWIASSLSLLAMTRSHGLERQRRDDADLLRRIELLHAERHHPGAIIDAGGDHDAIAAVGLHHDGLQFHRAGIVDDIERGTAALAEQ